MPCPCGSGKKYKVCCLVKAGGNPAETATPNTSPRESSRQLLADAIHLHARGNMAAAEEVYRKILRESPADPDALHYLGICHQQRGDLSEAERLIRKSIAYAPQNASFLSNFGNVLKALGQIEAAKHA